MSFKRHSSPTGECCGSDEGSEPASKRSKRTHNNLSVEELASVGTVGRDFVTIFSDELNLHVLEHLSAVDLSVCAQVSSQWYRLTNDRQLWKNLFLSRFRAPKRPNLTSRLEIIQMESNQQSSLQKTSLLKSIQQDVTTTEDWKTIYRVSHNWQTGNCRVIDFKPDVTRLKPPFSESSRSSGQSSNSIREHLRLMININSNPLVQFTKHIILTAAFAPLDNIIPKIQLWHAGKQNSHIATLVSAVLQEIANLPSQQPITITCLKLDSHESDHSDSSGETHKVVAGYSNGGFTIWEFDTILRDNGVTTDSHISLSLNRWSHRELCTALPLHSNRVGQNISALPVTTIFNTPSSPLIACTLHSPILVTCTSDFILSIYYIPENQAEDTAIQHDYNKENKLPTISCRLIHQLRSFVCWAPVDITIEECQESKGSVDDRDHMWKAVVAYSVSVYNGGWTVGVQEIRFTLHSIISTMNCSPLPPSSPSIFDSPFFSLASSSLSSSSFPLDNNSAATRISYAPITALTYNATYLITAHADNTVQVYHVLCDEHSRNDNGRNTGTLECRHVHTLYGHTGSVTTAAIDSDGKLITGAMDHCIKIWDLSGGNNMRRDSATSCNTIPSHYSHHHNNRHGGFQKIGLVAQRKRHGECIVTLSNTKNDDGNYNPRDIAQNICGGVSWVGFDEGRIVSVSSFGSSESVWTSNDNLTGANSQRNVSPPPGWNGEEGGVDCHNIEVGVIKVWSFCDD